MVQVKRPNSSDSGGGGDDDMIMMIISIATYDLSTVFLGSNASAWSDVQI